MQSHHPVCAVMVFEMVGRWVLARPMDSIVEGGSITVDGIGRLLVAIVLGSLVGLQREVDDQPAGLRTHLTVCLGAALFGVISTLGFDEFERTRSVGAGGTNVMVDVTRVASQVVVGIGFLGAGIIIRRGNTVRNVTTAASIWTTAAIGLAAGVGNAGIAALTTIFLLVTLAVLRLPRDWIRRRLTREVRRVQIRVQSDTDIDAMGTELAALDGVTTRIVGLGKSDGRIEFTVEIEGEPGVSPEVCLAPLVHRPSIIDIVLVDDADES